MNIRNLQEGAYKITPLLICMGIGITIGIGVTLLTLSPSRTVDVTVDVVDEAEKVDHEVMKSVTEVYNLHSERPLSVESRKKVDKIWDYMQLNPQHRSVADSEIKMNSVFVDLGIPIQEMNGAWDYYNSKEQK